jgi:hypothetical protein
MQYSEYQAVKKARGPWEVKQPLANEAIKYLSTNVPEKTC